jgi:hypothetical protein
MAGESSSFGRGFGKRLRFRGRYVWRVRTRRVAEWNIPGRHKAGTPFKLEVLGTLWVSSSPSSVPLKGVTRHRRASYLALGSWRSPNIGDLKSTFTIWGP